MNAIQFLTIFCYVLPSILAQSFYITNPIQGSILRPGTTEVITWINGTRQNATVTLLQGNNSLTMTPSGISFKIQGANGHYNWTVPTQLAQNVTYSLQISYKVNNTMVMSYSSPFAIMTNINKVIIAADTNSSQTVSSATAATTTSSITTINTFIPTPTKLSATSSLIASTTPTPSMRNSSPNIKSPFLITFICILSIFIFI